MITEDYRVLKIPLRKSVFNSVEHNLVTEHYREISDFWTHRFYRLNGEGRGYNMLEFVDGFQGVAPRSILREFLSLRIGRGKPKWGAPWNRDVYIISFGSEDWEILFRKKKA